MLSINQPTSPSSTNKCILPNTTSAPDNGSNRINGGFLDGKTKPALGNRVDRFHHIVAFLEPEFVYERRAVRYGPRLITSSNINFNRLASTSLNRSARSRV